MTVKLRKRNGEIVYLPENLEEKKNLDRIKKLATLLKNDLSEKEIMKKEKELFECFYKKFCLPSNEVRI